MFVYGFSASGMTVQFHYCCGKLKNVDWVPIKRSGCGNGHKMGSKPCCETKQLIANAIDHFNFQEAAKIIKDYVPFEERDENAEVSEEAEEMLEEFIEEMEDEETIKVAELMEVDPAFEFGIGLEVALNVEEITLEIIDKFITDFNNDTLQLDKTLYSFKNESED